MNNKYSKYCIASTKDGKRCKKYPMNDSNLCCVHHSDSHEVVPRKTNYCMLFVMYVTFLLHMCLFIYSVKNYQEYQEY